MVMDVMAGERKIILPSNRFNRKKGEALIPEARKAWRDLMVKIVRKKAADQKWDTGFKAENAVALFLLIVEQSEGELKANQMPFAAQNTLIACQFMLEILLDGELATQLLPEVPECGGYAYPLAFIQALEDAKMKLLDWGETIPLDEKVGMAIKAVKALPKDDPRKATGIETAVSALMAVKPEFLTAHQEAAAS